MTVTGRTRRRFRRPFRRRAARAPRIPLREPQTRFVAALCDALLQRRTASAHRGLSSFRDAPSASLRQGEAGVATPCANGRFRRIATSDGAMRRNRIACIFAAVVAR